MLSEKINLKNKYSKFSDYWSPKIIEEMNDYQFKLVKIKGDFVWHSHNNTDETFIVIEGEMTLKFRSREVNLSKGEIFVVEKGIEHKPYSKNECKILIIEPKGIINTGESVSELTVSEDNWI